MIATGNHNDANSLRAHRPLGIVTAANCNVRTSQSLPLWGRWQPEGLTEEVQYTHVIYTRYGEMEEQDLIRPALRRATFPKGEGMGAHAPVPQTTI